jgi:P pilus assembly chaperone PapD
MSVPVFLQPAILRPVPRVERLSVQGNHAMFVVTNPGTAHFIAKKVRLYVTAHDGRTLFDSTVGGWYVLAQGIRNYDIALPSTACTSGTSITVELETDQGNAVEHINASCTNASP